jgi:hypothetical protein
MGWIADLLIALVAVLGVATPAIRSRGRHLRQNTHRTISDCSDGARARIVGGVRLWNGETTRSPLAGRHCVAWVLRVYRRTWEGRSAYLELIQEDTTSVPFVVTDRTGVALVSARRSPPDLAVDYSDVVDLARRPSHEVSRVLAKYPGIKSAAAGSMVFEEAVLEAGDSVSVTGYGSWEPDEARAQPGGYREAPAGTRILVIRDADLSDHASRIS